MQTVAVVGGGQLARMMAAPATALGIQLRILASDRQDAAAQVVVDSHYGAAKDAGALADLVWTAPRADVLTFEHEHVDLAQVKAVLAAGMPVRPGPQALRYAQDKLAMRQQLSALGIPCPRWARVVSAADIDQFCAQVGPAVLKRPRGGYDGKGVRCVTSCRDGEDWLGSELLIEEQVDFDREIAVLLARRPSGEIACWPVMETVQSQGVCSLVFAGAKLLGPAVVSAAVDIGRTIAAELDVTGVLAVEMFVQGERVLVNELAMRPHNSGHWTIDGCVTSQFEQHLRAVLDLPLGDTTMHAPVAVMANIFGGDGPLDATCVGGAAKVHVYGKQPRPGRKLGHVTCLGDEVAKVRAAAESAAHKVRSQL